MSLAARVHAEELMDADDLDPAVYAAVVGDLAKANTVTLARRPTLGFLRRITRRGGTLRLLDVGFGDGDMLRSIARWAVQHDVTAELVGVDLNPRSEPAARAHTSPDLAIRYVTGDYADMGGGWDAIVSSLVAHHMTEEQLVAFLRFMEVNARAWFVNDLHRHRLARFGWRPIARVAGWHPIVRHDGYLSIARAFRPPEWRALLAEAGVEDARVFRAFPFRLCVERTR
jgi:2-polyprenyl-3-methyl-5-hydroxy-6-metoxy-1,4-benzoquinol methylase